MRRRGKGTALISAASSLLLLSALGGVAVSAAAADGINNAAASAALRHRRGLTQHRVPTARRQVPYPDDHPLARHLKNNGRGDGSSLEEEEREEDEEECEVGSSVVRGDGSRRQRKTRQRQQQRRNRHHRFLRFFTRPKSASTPAEGRRRRRRRREGRGDEPEKIQEGRLVENNLRYWTISGRELAVNATDGRRSHGSAAETLLVDVERINDENGEAEQQSMMQGQNWEGDGGEGDAGAVVEDNEAESSEDIMALTDDLDKDQSMLGENENAKGESSGDEFDTYQYYNHQETLNDREDAMPDAEHSRKHLYQPVRLRAIFTDDETSGSRYLTPLQRRILMEDMINPALFAWSKALHVVPVGRGGGRRRMRGMDDRHGTGGARIGDEDNLVVDRSQLYDGVSCGPGLDSGLPSVRVPREHTTTGLADTDTVIYISVSFAENSEPASSTSPPPKSSESPPHSLYHLHRGNTGPTYSGRMRRKDFGGTRLHSKTSVTSTNETSTAFPSAYPSAPPSRPPSSPPTETELFVESRPTCPGTYLASAAYCSSDQHDRPVAGILSLCISQNVHGFFHDRDRIERSIVTVMHEIGHVLGFNAQSLASFRDPDTGEPLTPRDSNGNVPEKKVECTGVFPRTRAEVPLPSKEIVEFRSVRGGVRAATMVTPTVRRVARNLFGCRTLPGAELESGEGQMFASDLDGESSLTPGECLGDHWARRLFRTDLMNAIVDDVPYSLYISSLTLAYFADSGWYRVDTDRIAPSSMWGRNAGCEFAEEKCIILGGRVHASSSPFFCNNFLEHEPEEGVTEIHGCDLDSSRKAVCSLVEYENPIPEEYDYFAKDKYLDHTNSYGGSDPTLDYCPTFEGFSNGQCEDEGAKELMEVRSSLEVFGEVNSRCVIGNVDRKRTALCLPIACVIEEQSLMVKVDGYWKPCSYAGQIMSVWWNPNDYVVCPDPSRMCPTFYCPNDCFREGGICDYQTGQCMCATVTNSSIGFSNYYSYQSCSGSGRPHFEANNQLVERMGVELPDYYVENTTLLLDDPRDFDDKVSRMFSQLNSGEVVGLVASFVMCVIFSFLVWSQLFKLYKQCVLGTSLMKVRSSVGSLTRLLRSPTPETDRQHDGTDSSPSSGGGPRRGGRNPQKDKMVATLLVQMRTESTAVAEQEQQHRLHLGGLVSTTTPGSDRPSSDDKTIVDLSSPSDGEVLINRSQLPALPEGRVLAVVGARIVEDESMEDDDARSSATSATQLSSHHTETSEFTSPLYQDDDDRRTIGGRMLRLRRHID